MKPGSISPKGSGGAPKEATFSLTQLADNMFPNKHPVNNAAQPRASRSQEQKLGKTAGRADKFEKLEPIESAQRPIVTSPLTNPFAKLMVGQNDKLLNMKIDWTNRDVRAAMSTLMFTRADLQVQPYESFEEKLISEDIQMMKYNYHIYEIYRTNFHRSRFSQAVCALCRKEKETDQRAEEDLQDVRCKPQAIHAGHGR